MFIYYRLHVMTYFMLVSLRYLTDDILNCFLNNDKNSFVHNTHKGLKIDNKLSVTLYQGNPHLLQILLTNSR